MTPPPPLFTIPILSSPSTTPLGSITCTTPAPRVYLITFTSPPDNRLVTGFCQALLLALDVLEFRHPPGVIITTSSIAKFYSNGLDPKHTLSTPGFFPDSLYALFRRLVTYPTPTIALINGHAFAGGLMLAFHHDYRIFTSASPPSPRPSLLCLNELDIGFPLKPAMTSIFKQKLSPPTLRTLILEAHRFSASEALDVGLVDALGGLDVALHFVAQRKLVDKARSGVYGALKAELARESVGFLESHDREEERAEGRKREDKEAMEEATKRVEVWEKSQEGAKAKL